MHQHRLHALDAIRAIALLLGLLLHGSMSFWSGLEDYGFPVSDNSKSLSLTYMFYVLHMFRMSVFFLIAGFFAHMSLQRKGTLGFLKDRLKRIALPMLVAWIFSMILIIPTVLWAASKLYQQDYLEILQASRETAPAMPVLIHFWFLYYLLWFYVIAVFFSWTLHQLNRSEQIIKTVTRLVYFLCRIRILAIIAAVISAWTLYLRDDWLLWGGIPTPTEAVWNERPAFIIYGMAFFFGWIFDRQRDCFTVLISHWPTYLGIAVLMTGLCITQLNPVPFALVEVSGMEKLFFAATYSLASWCWIFAMIGAGMQCFNQESELRRYIADASYWIYISHIPLIFFLQTLLMEVPWHWSVKFFLIISITSTLLFWSYEKFVRYTFIGRTLNGPRQRKSPGN